MVHKHYTQLKEKLISENYGHLFEPNIEEHISYNDPKAPTTN